MSRPVKVFCWLGWKAPRTSGPPCGDRTLAPWPKAGRGRSPWPRPASTRQVESQASLPSVDDHPHAGQRGPLRLEERQAGVELLRRRLVVRRRAAHRGGDPGVAQRQAVAPRLGDREAGEAGGVHRRHQEQAGAIAGEHPAGAVGAVRAGRQADDQQARLGIAEAGQRAAPVGLVAIRGALHRRDVGAVRPQPRAPRARDDLAMAGAAEAHPRAAASASACSCAWYELRTSGPDSTWPKPRASAIRFSSANSSGW